MGRNKKSHVRKAFLVALASLLLGILARILEALFCN
jgi:hypothetical protein